jgi:hypothetical protein
VNSVGLDAMHRELSNDLLFVFGKNRGNLSHIGSINRGPVRRAAKARGYRRKRNSVEAASLW